MRHYELTYLISANLSEEETKSLLIKITSLIQKEEGVLDNFSFDDSTKGVIRKKLAHPIKKQSQGYLINLKFSLNPEKLSGLEKKIKLENKIIRFMILIVPPTKKVSLKEKRKFKTVPVLKEIPAHFKKPGGAVTEKEKKVELKEIDKKLEEILKE